MTTPVRQAYPGEHPAAPDPATAPDPRPPGGGDGPTAGEGRTAGDGPTAAEVYDRLAGWLAEAVLAPDAGLTAPLRDLGVDSLDLIRTARRIEAGFGVQVQLRELFGPELTAARLAELVAERAAGRGGAAAAPPGAAHGPVVLTPAQEHAWEEQTGDRGHWNQAMLFTTRPGIEPGLFAEAVRRLVAGHASLRLAVEERPARRPRQLAAALATDGPPEAALGAVLDTVDVSELADAALSAAITLRCAVEQRSLDPGAGRVARFVRFDAGPRRPGRLLITVHQMAVDMVSWSVLLADLEEVYTALEAGRRDVWPTEGTSYPEWARALAAHARTPEAEEQAEWWTEVARTPAGLPPDHPVADPRAVNTAATAATHREEFPGDLTARLHTAARTHRAHPGDLVLHALGQVLADRLGEPAVRLDVLRHGREETVGDTRLSRTTGWFTTTVPVRLDFAPGTPAERLARTVGHLAALPGGGVGFGALARHGRPRIAAALRAVAPSDVSFDFEGDDADTLPLGTLLPDVAPEPVGDITAGHWTRPHPVEVIATTDDGVLRVEWWYSTALHEEATVRALADRHRAALTALLDALSGPGAPGAPQAPTR
ncbi:non-ribosomal peptide synthase protein (TIGR01720 family) [Streptomyces sp. Ag109_G2-6]|uniref:condensation domain-containing protein n=1 Tax=Streptomyces TaxID=1883 RepID=UPI000FB80C65|nr:MULTISPECIES: condensation domain-containing protein [Streptomyces]RPF44210.1 non-ribosomal peptide synthase protein (TIGR01720 family) [Streptomyces sp. Ag109_G2-6]